MTRKQIQADKYYMGKNGGVLYVEVISTVASEGTRVVCHTVVRNPCNSEEVQLPIRTFLRWAVREVHSIWSDRMTQDNGEQQALAYYHMIADDPEAVLRDGRIWATSKGYAQFRAATQPRNMHPQQEVVQVPTLSQPSYTLVPEEGPMPLIEWETLWCMGIPVLFPAGTGRPEWSLEQRECLREAARLLVIFGDVNEGASAKGPWPPWSEHSLWEVSYHKLFPDGV